MCVLEDDAVPARRFREGVAAILDELPATWDHCYLFWHRQCWRAAPLPGRTVIQRAFETWGTVAYLVSRRGAARLLAATTRGKCERAVDETIMKLVRDGGLESYCATDLLCGTAGQLDPTQDPAATPLGSNVWGARTLAGSLAADADSDLDG